MGYRALLFCPDEKTARTVTQVLGDLDFTVEPCAEPFAAVKKLMGEHFDALVVDCDNEQNATLLFKSARNSTSNQASLAVAVVEGQAGVAKAFRIGANLVLTKPINVEQAKGTLRVARGLLRKGEPGKPAAPAAGPAAQTATPATPASAKPIAPPKPAAPAATTPRPAVPSIPAPATPTSGLPPIPKPAVHAHPPAAVAKSAPADSDEDLLEINIDEPANAAPAARVAPAASRLASPVPALPVPAASATPSAPAFKAPAPTFGGGAASAPAPAREPHDSHAAAATSASTKADELFEKPTDAVATESTTAPTAFTFGGAATPEESTGGSKKIILGVAAAVIVGVALYVALGHFKGSSSQAPTVPSTTAAQPASTPAKPAATAAPASAPITTPTSSAPSTSQPAQPITTSAAPSTDDAADDNEPAPSKEAPSPSSKPAKPANAGSSADKPSASTKPAAAPLVVKGGAAPATKASPAAPEAPPPSVMMAAPGSSAPPLNLVGNAGPAPKPVLQTMNVSQGVSQGLLIKKVQPQYPSNALALHVEGDVDLQATISKSGNIAAIKVVSGPPLLTRAAQDAVKQWKYKPYLLNGEPVEIQTQITVKFRLPH